MNEKTIKRDSFVFYRSFYDSISLCPDEVQIVLLRAVLEYGFDQVVPDFSGTPFEQFTQAIWAGIKPQLDANYQRFLNGCKGGEFGNRGGAPKGNTNARKQPQNNPETTPNVNVNVNENENENEGLVLPFPNNPEFVVAWNQLRKQPKWKDKSIQALQKSLDALRKYEVQFAIELINTAIGGNYQAVTFFDTPVKYQQWKQLHPRRTRPAGKVITDPKDLYKDL